MNLSQVWALLFGKDLSGLVIGAGGNFRYPAPKEVDIPSMPPLLVPRPADFTLCSSILPTSSHFPLNGSPELSGSFRTSRYYLTDENLSR